MNTNQLIGHNSSIEVPEVKISVRKDRELILKMVEVTTIDLNEDDDEKNKYQWRLIDHCEPKVVKPRSFYGVISYAQTGGIYKGVTLNGKAHGQGKTTYKNGDCFEGSFLDNKLHGQGKYTDDQGNTWEGDWMNGQMHGKVKWTLIDGTIVYYEYDNGKKIRQV